MAKEICISSTPHETRLAILEDDQLAEIYYERENEYTLAGSIYNGRVTRVLPGMQSAFVDVGLERDAFLYVTDFLELEDPEEADELEKAAVAGGAQPPREIRHTNVEPTPQNGRARTEDRGQRNAQRPDQKQEPRQERPANNRQLKIDPIPDATVPPFAIPESQSNAEQAEYAQDESGPGAKRWRGRRRRRGGRGSSNSPDDRTESTPSPTTEPENFAPPAAQLESQPTPGGFIDKPSPQTRPSQSSTPSFAPSTGQTPVSFVLPGESLSRYGASPAEDAPRSTTPVAPVRPSSSFKPSSLIEAPLAWDGSGLLPGESISRHRSTKPDQSTHSSAHADLEIEEYSVVPDTFDEAEEYGLAPDATEEQDFFAESTASTSDPNKNPAHNDTQDYTVEPILDEPSADEPVAPSVVRQDEETADQGSHTPNTGQAERDDHQSDASASHHVDPAAPTGFRLFGLGGKKKAEESGPVLTPDVPPTKAASTATISSYAPGTGLIEEEVIDGEEFDTPRHHAKTEEHEFDFEEETLPPQVRSGDLGEMLQEAHLDHRIQLNFDEKSTEDESFDEEDEDDEPSADAQPATADSQAQQRRDRGGRGRRGRGAPSGAPAQSSRRGGPSRRSMQTSNLPIISDLLKPGQEILVQIAKEPIAKKGARITSHIALPGRFLVFMPTVTHIGVSRKIASDEERQRLKRILVSERGEAAGGFIVRTAAENASEEDLRADLRFLLHLWDEIKQRSESSKSPALIYHDLSLIERILRDQVSANFSSIWVDSQEDYERIVRFLNRFSPNLVRRVKLYTKEVPLFEHFGIQDEISKALRSKVWLKSGGSIVINQTEALVAIDINTGKYVGKSARLEDTILKTNLDAVPEIVRQIRLRDLGGIIVIDFIDMDERKNRFKVMAALEEALKSDRAPTKVLQFNDFGLVAITRKRVKQSLERTLSVPCPTCQATGMVKSPTTVCNEIYTELRKMKKYFEGADVLLRVNPETVKVLKSNNASWLTEFEELVGKNILVKSDATLHPEQFDIQG